VFFRDERHALASGYRPCAVCLPEKYRAWRKKRSATKERRR
jgi:methylphosphotriester-DNA--protein-cysteine methyltransferase